MQASQQTRAAVTPTHTVVEVMAIFFAEEHMKPGEPQCNLQRLTLDHQFSMPHPKGPELHQMSSSNSVHEYCLCLATQ